VVVQERGAGLLGSLEEPQRFELRERSDADDHRLFCRKLFGVGKLGVEDLLRIGLGGGGDAEGVEDHVAGLAMGRAVDDKAAGACAELLAQPDPAAHAEVFAVDEGFRGLLGGGGDRRHVVVGFVDGLEDKIVVGARRGRFIARAGGRSRHKKQQCNERERDAEKAIGHPASLAGPRPTGVESPWTQSTKRKKERLDSSDLLCPLWPLRFKLESGGSPIIRWRG
jgi:hypothetical protein